MLPTRENTVLPGATEGTGAILNMLESTTKTNSVIPCGSLLLTTLKLKTLKLNTVCNFQS